MKNKKLEMALNGPIIKTILTMAIPILIANLLQSAYQLTDAFWVGRLGKEAVAAVSISFPITFFMISVGSGFSIAGTTLISQYFGAKNMKMVDKVAAQTILMVFCISIFLGIIGYIFAGYILMLMGVEKEVFGEALSFLKISFIGMIFVFLFAMFQSLMRGLGEVKIPLKIVLFTVLLNFIIDPLFIFGYGFFPGLGVSGAAWATLVTQALASIAGFYILLKGKYGIHIKISDFKPDLSYIKKAFFLGLPSSIEMSARSLSMIVMTFLVTSFGTVAIASYGAGGNVFQLVIILSMGISMASSILVGQNIGAKNVDRAEKIIKVSIFMSFLFLSFIGIIVFLFAKQLIGFFVPNEKEIIEMGATFLRTIALSFGFIGIQMGIIWAFRASGNMLTSLNLTLVSQWLFQFPLGYILSKHTSLGIDGIWYSIFITNFLMIFVCLGVFFRGTWKKTNIIDDDYKTSEKIYEEVIIEEGIKN
ncbi:MATE family efflux transporter [Candidatus Gracilibacteria bacterium]|nr:MATE family efflux transporter [Candidatus Gracilibacteria bacterium]